MGGLLVLVLVIAIVFLVPIGLGVLATGRVRRHDGPTTCTACGYELTGIDGRVSACPECGGRLAGEGTVRTGVERFRAHPWYVRYPAVALLLAAPFGVFFLATNVTVNADWVRWAVVAAYVVAIGVVCRVPARRPLLKIGKVQQHGDGQPTAQEEVTLTPPS